jgi:hypothetical protein
LEQEEKEENNEKKELPQMILVKNKIHENDCLLTLLTPILYRVEVPQREMSFVSSKELIANAIRQSCTRFLHACIALCKCAY